jgi:hypothetical protein
MRWAPLGYQANIVCELRRMNDVLAGQTGDVRTGSSNMFALHDCDTLTASSERPGKHLRAGAAAEDEEVKFLRLALKTYHRVCSPSSSRRDRKRGRCAAAIVDCRLDGSASSVHGEFRAVNETGTVCGQENNCFGNFLG